MSTSDESTLVQEPLPTEPSRFGKSLGWIVLVILIVIAGGAALLLQHDENTGEEQSADTQATTLQQAPANIPIAPSSAPSGYGSTKIN